DLPQNLELLGWLEFQGPRFNELLNQSRVICIPSRMESFAAAALDGAAMGCVPVGFAVGALPEILEGLGSVAPSETIDAFVATVKAVVSAEKTDVEKIRHLAVTRFSIEKRQRAIGEVIEQLFLG
ncbi:MAG: glycosyltransferase, partial [Bdellovibrionales bacterium]